MGKFVIDLEQNKEECRIESSSSCSSSPYNASKNRSSGFFSDNEEKFDYYDKLRIITSKKVQYTTQHEKELEMMSPTNFKSSPSQSIVRILATKIEGSNFYFKVRYENGAEGYVFSSAIPQNSNLREVYEAQEKKFSQSSQASRPMLSEQLLQVIKKKSHFRCKQKGSLNKYHNHRSFSSRKPSLPPHPLAQLVPNNYSTQSDTSSPLPNGGSSCSLSRKNTFDLTNYNNNNNNEDEYKPNHRSNNNSSSSNEEICVHEDKDQFTFQTAANSNNSHHTFDSPPRRKYSKPFNQQHSDCGETPSSSSSCSRRGNTPNLPHIIDCEETDCIDLELAEIVVPQQGNNSSTTTSIDEDDNNNNNNNSNTNSCTRFVKADLNDAENNNNNMSDQLNESKTELQQIQEVRSVSHCIDFVNLCAEEDSEIELNVQAMIEVEIEE